MALKRVAKFHGNHSPTVGQELKTGLNKFPGDCPVGIKEILQRILGKFVIKDCGKDVTHTFGVQISFNLVIFLSCIQPYFLIREMGRCTILGKASVE